MISLDPRAGSGPLLAPLRALSLPVKSRRLEYGDLAFRGQGPKGITRIGIEYKKLGDLLACIVDKRLVSHQMPGLLRSYSYVYLLVEGVVRPSPDSSLECLLVRHSDRTGRDVAFFNTVYSALTYSAMQRYLFTLENLAGVRVRFTSTQADTLGYLSALYHWWQKPWGKHHAHLALPAREDSNPRRAEAMFRRPSVLRRIASCLPGVGWTRSRAIANRFRSVSGMVDASEKDWLGIEGVGPRTAAAIHKALREVTRD